MIARIVFTTCFILSTVTNIILPMDMPLQENQTPILLNHQLSGHTDLLSAVSSFYKDGWYAVSGAQDTTVRIWDLEKLECVGVLEGHTNNVTALCCMLHDLDNHDSDMLIISGGGKVLGSGTDDFSIRVCSFATGKCEKILEGHTDSVNAICVIKKNSIASCSDDNTVKIWNLDEGICIKSITVQGDELVSLARLDDSHLVCANFQAGSINIINIDLGTCVRRFNAPYPGNDILLQAISPDEFISWNFQFDVWNWKAGTKVESFIGNSDIENCLGMQDYGTNKIIVSTVWDGCLRVFDYVAKEQVQSFKTGLTGVGMLALADKQFVYALIPLQGVGPILYVSPNPNY